MVTRVENSPFAGRPTTLGEKLMQDARRDLARSGPGRQDTSAEGIGGRVIEDTVEFATVDLGGQKAVNFASASQSAAEVRAAKAEDLAAALDRGLARGFHVGDLFRSVFKGMAGLFRGRAT